MRRIKKKNIGKSSFSDIYESNSKEESPENYKQPR
jgi:hypothetical protein